MRPWSVTGVMRKSTHPDPDHDQDHGGDKLCVAHPVVEQAFDT